MSDQRSTNDAYDEILRDHANLRRLLDELRQMLFEQAVDFADLKGHFFQLGEMLEGHFRTEEASGCFGEVVNQAPHVSGKVAGLIGEHADLSREINEIAVRASGGNGTADDWEVARAAFGDFTARLMQHEMLENELLQQAFTEDIGWKD